MGIVEVILRQKSMRSTALGVARIVHIESMNDFLMWPYTPKHKGKRQTERHPIEITSEKYKYMFEMKHFAKDAEEKEK